MVRITWSYFQTIGPREVPECQIQVLVIWHQQLGNLKKKLFLSWESRISGDMGICSITWSHGRCPFVPTVVETSLIPIQMNWWYQRAIPENVANWKWHLSHSDESEPGWKHIAWSPDYLAHRYTIFLCIWAGKYRWSTQKYKYEWQRSSSWAIN